MKVPAVVSAFVVAAVLPLSAGAETLRCGNRLIQEGASMGEVAEKCGSPESKETFTEPVFVRRIDGTTFQNGTTSRDVWRYRRAKGQFPAVLTFEMGVLKKIEFEKG